jgi:hypothetical protein
MKSMVFWSMLSTDFLSMLSIALFPHPLGHCVGARATAGDQISPARVFAVSHWQASLAEKVFLIKP